MQKHSIKGYHSLAFSTFSSFRTFFCMLELKGLVSDEGLYPLHALGIKCNVNPLGLNQIGFVWRT